VPSLACRAYGALQAPRFWEESSPFSTAMGMVPAGRGGQDAMPFLLSKLQ